MTNSVGKGPAKKETAPGKTVAMVAIGKSSPKRRLARMYRGAKVLGVTTDGIMILKGKGRASNFTVKEIRAAIFEARTARNAR